VVGTVVGAVVVDCGGCVVGVVLGTVVVGTVLAGRVIGEAISGRRLLWKDARWTGWLGAQMLPPPRPFPFELLTSLAFGEFWGPLGESWAASGELPDREPGGERASDECRVMWAVSSTVG
jgi:hypothetical protein